MSIKYGEYFLFQSVYIIMLTGALFIMFAYTQAEADLKMLFYIAVATWIALLAFLILVSQAAKRGYIRDPASVLSLPQITTPIIINIAYYVIHNTNVSQIV